LICQLEEAEMDDPLVVSLVVSGIGMLTLFLALAILCGLMYLMTRITNIRFIKDRPEAVAGEQGSRGAGEQGSRGAEEQRSKDARERRAMQRRAAVIAVALARAEADRKRPLDLSPIGAPGAGEAVGVSAWRALHHQRQLTLNLPTRRVR
jgi:Na+-transporting methylmalonyl-CoA/oxaloacetate decarboxylase gamma subunit